MAEFVNFYLIPGLVLGSIYALGAIGITLTFGILRFANFSHGETMTLGRVLRVDAGAADGSCTRWSCMPRGDGADRGRRAGHRPRVLQAATGESPTIMLVIASFGLMLMIRSVIQFFWGVQLKTVLPGISDAATCIGDFLRIAPKHLLIVGGCDSY